MARIAIVRDSDLPVRGSDDAVRDSDGTVGGADVTSSVRDLVAAAHQVVDVASCEAFVVVLTPGTSGLADRVLPARPCVVVIESATTRGDREADHASVASHADAYVIGARGAVGAIAWVLEEDRAERTRGQPRLTVIGTLRDDLGMTRPLTAEPMILGRSSSFRAEHPMRRDRMPTPTGSIARSHARARYLDGVVSVCDLRSTNGTLLIRWGAPARLLCPQQAGGGRAYGPPATPWLVRDPTPDYVELAFGDHLQLPGYWRFRVDGDPAWSD